MTPKGTVLIIGGAEDKGDEEKDIHLRNRHYEKLEILRELLPKDGGSKRIEIITTASKVPEQMEQTYSAAFDRIGYKNVGFIDIRKKADARKASFCERVEQA